MKKDVKICSALYDRTWEIYIVSCRASVVRNLRGGEGLPKIVCLVGSSFGTSVVCVRLPVAPLYKGDTVGLRRGRGDLRRLSAAECDRLEGAQGGLRPHSC